MKVEREAENVFVVGMERSDASEDEIAYAMRTIRDLLDEAEAHGYGPDVRAADRARGWRYARVEKALMCIRHLCDASLEHVKLLDFAEAGAEPVDYPARN